MSLSNHDFERILICASEADISDIYITPNQPVFWKRYGDISPLRDYVPAVEDLWRIFTRVSSDEVREKYVDGDDVVFSYDMEIWKFRFTAFRSKEKLSFAIRTIRKPADSFEKLDEASVIENYLDGHGLVIVAGDNGSGRTTTINTALKYLIDHKDISITTLQKVMMFTHSNSRAMVHHREYGSDFCDWNQAIETTMLNGSDVVYVSDYDTSMADSIIKLAKRKLVLLRVDGISFTDIKETLSDYDSKLQKRFEAVTKFTMIQRFEHNPAGGMVIKCKTMPPKTKE